MVSAKSPTTWYDSSNNHSVTPDNSMAQNLSSEVLTVRFGFLPVSKAVVHRASLASAVAK